MNCPRGRSCDLACSTGTALGTVVSMLLSGLLAGWLGWASVFYVMGGLSLVWCALWAALAADSPATQRPALISAAERELIERALGLGTAGTSASARGEVSTQRPNQSLCEQELVLGFPFSGQRTTPAGD